MNDWLTTLGLVFGAGGGGVALVGVVRDWLKKRQDAPTEEQRRQALLERSLDRMQLVDDNAVKRLEGQLARQDEQIATLARQGAEREAYRMKDEQRHREEIAELTERAQAAEERAERAEQEVRELRRRLDALVEGAG